MAYSITKTNGSPLAVVQDATINTTSSALTLIGRDYAGYGAFLNENFVRLLENFSANVAPSKKLTGQLWYDSSINSLKVWSDAANIWKPVGSTIAEAYPGPATATSVLGDLWYDTTNKMLKVWDEATSAWVLIGPPATGVGNESGAVVDTIDGHTVIKLLVDTNLVGIVSWDAAFTPTTTVSGFPVIKPGLNLVNSSTVSGSQLTGDASNALTVGGVSAGQFLRSDQNTTTAYQLTMLGGAVIGADGLTIVNDTANSQVILNSTGTGNDFNFYINKGGNPVRSIGISGSTGVVTFANSVVVNETLTASSGFTVSVGSPTTLGGITTLQDVLLPNADNTIAIGSASQKFSEIRASSFVGNLINGNITATSATIAGWANATVGMSVAGSPVSTFANVQSYVQYTGRNSQGNKFVSTSAPSGGQPGDIWYQI